MIKNTLGLFSLLISLAVSAQEVVATQGYSYSNASAKIDFTIGEVVISTGLNGTTNLTQGFHQTNWNFLGVQDFASDYEVTIFPNPTADVLYIKTSKFENVMYSMYDEKGKLVLQDKLSAEQTTIQVRQLAPGAYSLNLNKPMREHQYLPMKTYKLIKQK